MTCIYQIEIASWLYTGKKISESKKGHKVSQETREKLRQANLGKTLGLRRKHPCPVCGEQRAERYRKTGEFLGYHKTCRKPGCVKLQG